MRQSVTTPQAPITVSADTTNTKTAEISHDTFHELSLFDSETRFKSETKVSTNLVSQQAERSPTESRTDPCPASLENSPTFSNTNGELCYFRKLSGALDYVYLAASSKKDIMVDALNFALLGGSVAAFMGGASAGFATSAAIFCLLGGERLLNRRNVSRQIEMAIEKYGA